MRTAGQIIVFNALKGGMFSAGQRVFTGLPYTHTAILVNAPYPAIDIDSYFGADLTVSTQPLDKALSDPTYLYQMYKPIGWTDEQIRIAFTEVYKRYAGEEYGFLQIAWFIYRGVAERWPFHADVRKGHNWFPNHPICSEVGWWYFYQLAIQRLNDAKKLIDRLNEWRPDTFHSGDAARTLQAFPDLFQLTEERWQGPR